MKLIYERYETINPNYELELKENEELTLISFNNNVKDAKLTLHAKQQTNSKLYIYNFILNEYNSSLYQDIDVLGLNTNTIIINLILSSKNSKIDSNISINHLNKNTKSLLETYAISKDESVIKIENVGKIKQGCHKVSVRQKAKGLTLSNQSKIEAKPILYIDEYDVEASHACSIGSVNKDDLFYLMSRGLDEKEARKLIVQGFLTPIIDRIEDKKIKEEISNIITNRI